MPSSPPASPSALTAEHVRNSNITNWHRCIKSHHNRVIDHPKNHLHTQPLPSLNKVGKLPKLFQNILIHHQYQQKNFRQPHSIAAGAGNRMKSVSPPAFPVVPSTKQCSIFVCFMDNKAAHPIASGTMKDRETKSWQSTRWALFITIIEHHYAMSWLDFSKNSSPTPCCFTQGRRQQHRASFALNLTTSH
ncbi:hypothetical protein Nepgr_007893 [Nepenthes gracilis]|uniref:Uncharacterized protein n=1 Tax=Nepenthes gracilis TaxID=150966 RepID=A0AAD3S7V1_NEPGR|nr:hypothetical protein Nepgr_007893 [Nepenthes gracilis]